MNATTELLENYESIKFSYYTIFIFVISNIFIGIVLYFIPDAIWYMMFIPIIVLIPNMFNSRLVLKEYDDLFKNMDDMNDIS